MQNKLFVSNHALVSCKLAVLRAAATDLNTFRSTLRELSILLLAEAARQWPTAQVTTDTPLAQCVGAELKYPVVLVPILRAGLGMVDGILQILPRAAVGHIGLYRDEQTLRPVAYYSRFPRDLAGAEVVLLDPMLATGYSACAAIATLKERGALRITFITIVACPTGIEQVQTTHPDVPIITGAIDAGLNDRGYIVPGLGDAGDRYFGTG